MSNNLLNAYIAGFFGLFLGSFLNVIFLRFGHWKSIATTRSECPHCKHILAWYDLIPVLSFLQLRGKCRYCRKPISIQYPLIEIITGLVTYIIWRTEDPHSVLAVVHTIALLVFAYTMLVMTLEDIREMAVPDSLFSIAFVTGALVAVTGQMEFSSILVGVAEAAGLLLLLVLVSRERWMGWGDVFLAVSVGFVLGAHASLVWLYAAFIIGSLWGVGLMALKIKTRKDPVPFIPVLMLSFMIAYVYGNMLVEWYLQRFLI